MSYKGKYRPKHPNKYNGDPTNIIYRSSWELKLMVYLDEHKDIVQWSSEEFCVPYRSPIDGRMHRYFPDFWIKRRAGGCVLIEVKPHKQTMPPDIKNKNKTKSGRISRRYLNEVKTWGINEAKWKAAEEYCKDRGWKFKIMTEKELGV
tara:strand:+ start:1281 stop:1724 length:444 start_codon:yes stop_codon:yes gene_type:complete